MKVIKAPEDPAIGLEHLLGLEGAGITLFLAGSIEMGKAEMWQDRVAEELSDVDGVILNPRRDNWDVSWEQTPDNPDFLDQVTWELDALETAEYTIFYFQPGTKSPITLMELGLRLRDIHYHEDAGQNIFVVCPEGFWRKGNVEITCARYAVPVYEDLSSALNDLRSRAGR